MHGIRRISALALAAAVMVAPGVASAAEPQPLAGLACMIANAGQGSAPVYDTPTGGAVVNRSMPVVLAVVGPGGTPEQRAGRVHIRTPSNHDGWVEARLLAPYPNCTPVLMRDPAGRPLLGFK